MNEDRVKDSELEEPEGFWPDEPWPDQEPFDVVPYTPDAPEFAPSEDPFAKGSAFDDAGHDVPKTVQQQTAGESYERHQAKEPIDLPVVEAPAEPRAENQYSWAVPVNNNPAPAEDAPMEPPVPSDPIAEQHSYAYHTTEEPVAPEPQREWVDTRSWLDDSQETGPQDAGRQNAADTIPAQWDAQPQSPPDPFAIDPFAPKAVEEYWVGQPAYSDPNAPVHYVPETPEENIRRSGLAWSAGIAFFGSVAFMLFLGWLADLLLGTSPWGMVGGIVLGSVIGFVQFFRISSQIYGTNKQSTEFRPLLNQSDDDIVNENVDPPATPPIL